MKKRIGFVTNFVFSEYANNVADGVREYCVQNDIELLLFSVGFLSPDVRGLYTTQYGSIAPFITAHNLDGIIMCTGSLLHTIEKPVFAEFAKSFDGLPVVSASVKLDGIPSVVPEYDKEFDALIQYVIDAQGCKKFAFLGVKSVSDEVVKRTAIFKRVLERNNIPLEDSVFFESDFSYGLTYAQLYEYNEANGFDFDAIVALNDDMAFAGIEFCQNFLKKRVPDDIIVTGFDNIPRGSFSSPTLTSIDQRISQIGYECAEVLCKKLRGENVLDVYSVKSKAILRQSSEKRAALHDACQKSAVFADAFADGFEKVKSENSVLLWYTRRSQILQAATFYTSENVNKDVREAGKMITHSLQSFGLQGAAVVVLDNPINVDDPQNGFTLPTKATLIAGFDYKLNFNTLNSDAEITFDPTETILPRRYMMHEPLGTVVLPVFFHTMYYGYMLLKYGDYDVGVYELLQRSISYNIKIAFEYEGMQKRQNEILQQNELLDMLSQTDEMTGLKNRRGFFFFAQPLLTLAMKNRQSGYIFFCDMDGLKKINDTYGHESGDRAIIAESKVLSAVFSAGDVLARLGGDEFAVICPNLESDKVEKIKERIIAESECIKKREEMPFDFSLSVGYVKYPCENGCYQIDTLLSIADKALYTEKRRKKEGKVTEETAKPSIFRCSERKS